MGIETNLKNLRIKSGFTQRQIAERLNVTRQTISSYESGRTQPDVEMIEKLAAIYRVDISDIVYGYDRDIPKSFRLFSIAHFLVQIVFTGLFCSLMLYMNLKYTMPVGNISLDQMVVFEKHLQFSKLIVQVENLFLAESLIGTLLALGWVILGRFVIRTLPWKKYCISLICILLIIPFVCAALDPVFMLANYIFTPGIAAMLIIITMAVLSRVNQ